MKKIKLTIIDEYAEACLIGGVITAGETGVEAEVDIQGDMWEGLSTRLVASCNGKAVESIIDNGVAIVPHECLIGGYNLLLGVDGRSASGEIRVPTVWAKVCTVAKSVAEATPAQPTPPTPDIVDQIHAAATAARNDAAAAEAAAEETAKTAEQLQQTVGAQLDALYATGTAPVPPREWLNKYVDAGTGVMVTPQPTMTRLCNTAMIPMHAGDAIKVSPGNKYRVALYDADGNFLRSEPSTGFVAGGYYVVTDDYNVRVTLAMSNLSGLFPDLDGDQYCEFVPYSYLRMAYEMLGLRVADLEKGSGIGTVESVNGMTGKVQLKAGDVGAYSKAETDDKLSKKANTTDIPKPYDDKYVRDALTEIKDDLSKLDDAVKGKYTKPESGIPATDLAAGVIPTKLPAPNKLTFTGAATGEFDGSAPVTIDIPQGGGGGEKPWNHARFDITTESEQVKRFIINNTETISEVVVIGKFLFETYDGIGVVASQPIHVNNIKPSASNCYVSFQASKTANGLWHGFGSASQWTSISAYFTTKITPYYQFDGNGNISVGSFWGNITMLVGTYADVWWR